MLEKPYRFFHEVYIPSCVMVDCPNCHSRVSPEILPEVVKSQEYFIDWRVGRCPVCNAECILPLGFTEESERDKVLDNIMDLVAYEDDYGYTIPICQFCQKILDDSTRLCPWLMYTKLGNSIVACAHFKLRSKGEGLIPSNGGEQR